MVPCSESNAVVMGDMHAYIEAISAMDVLTARKPVHATRNIQINPAVPPLIRPMIEVLAESA